jgi:hypothetical protein
MSQKREVLPISLAFLETKIGSSDSNLFVQHRILDARYLIMWKTYCQEAFSKNTHLFTLLDKGFISGVYFL